MGTLQQMYALLHEGRDLSNMHIPYSDVVYIRAALRARGHDVTLEHIESVLEEIGYIPSASLGIPKWFRKKYGI